MSEDEVKMTIFHFKMDTKMIDDLKSLDLFQKTRSMAVAINCILLQFFTVIEKEHMFGAQRESRYELINEDREVKRKHVTVSIPDYIYRRLKMLHDDLNFFSIAQLLRWLISGYVDFVKKYGDRWVRKLVTIIRRWQKDTKNSRFLLTYINQLFECTSELTWIILKYAIYCLHFSPYRDFNT
ncbi:MAG: hypothetical protein JXB88_00360 [Spirochaetales bacterium]|nr:hypothetical protein [Spirochaetales bacterium]